MRPMRVRMPTMETRKTKSNTYSSKKVWFILFIFIEICYVSTSHANLFHFLEVSYMNLFMMATAMVSGMDQTLSKQLY